MQHQTSHKSHLCPSKRKGGHEKRGGRDWDCTLQSYVPPSTSRWQSRILQLERAKQSQGKSVVGTRHAPQLFISTAVQEISAVGCFGKPHLVTLSEQREKKEGEPSEIPLCIQSPVHLEPAVSKM